MWMDRGIVVVYIAILIGLGVQGGRYVRSVKDFTACGGQYGTWIIFATLAASYIGGGFSAGNAAKAYEYGIGTTLTLFGFSISMILIGKFLVPGVWRFAGVSSVGGIIGQCYGRKPRILTGIFCFLCAAGMIGAQIEAIGLVFNVVLGVERHIGALIGCAVMLVYSTIGGMQSVIATDIVQFILLAVGMPLLLFMGVRASGGIGVVLENVPATHWDPFNGTTPMGFVSLFFAMMFGEALSPPYTQRLLVGKNAKATSRGTILSGVFSIFFFIITGTIGLVSLYLGVADTAATAMPDLVLKVLPVGIRGIVMAAMVSIMLSSADGLLNSAAISLVCDTIVPLKSSLSDRTQLILLRLVNIATGGLALAMAFAVPDIFRILVFAYSFWSPLVLVPLSAAFLGVKADTRTFLLAVLAGFVVTFGWNLVLSKPWGIDGCLFGVLANLAVFCFLVRRKRKTERLPGKRGS